MPFAIGDKERDQWMQCMTQALNDVVEDEVLRKELLAAIGKVADFMRNKD
jgi:hemoglobin